MVAIDPGNFMGHVAQHWNEYQLSMQVLEENTFENAKRLGALDAQELYPDMPVHTLEEFAKECYSMAEPGEVYNRAS